MKLMSNDHQMMVTLNAANLFTENFKYSGEIDKMAKKHFFLLATPNFKTVNQVIIGAD